MTHLMIAGVVAWIILAVLFVLFMMGSRHDD